MVTNVSPKSFMQKYSVSLSKKQNRKQKKVTDVDFSIPNFKEYSKLETINYRLSQLKVICRHYHLKVGGNKDELIHRIYNYLRLSIYSKKIQKAVKAHQARQYVICKGKRWHKPKEWINETDFLTLSSWDDVSPTHYFTYTNQQNQTYGFNLVSLIDYIKTMKKGKTSKQPMNPYTREPFCDNTLKRLYKIVSLSSIFNIKLREGLHNKKNTNVIIQSHSGSQPGSQSGSGPVISQEELEQNTRHRITSLFQEIDSFGHYTQEEWFSNLSIHRLIRFARELLDIWTYRANLSLETKREICPPRGNLFGNVQVNNHFVQFRHMNILDVKNIILGVLEKLVKRGVTQDARGLGVYYVLTTLTLVSPEAAQAMPWLYDSVAPLNDT